MIFNYTTDTNINDICIKALKKLNTVMEGESPEIWQLNEARENLVILLDHLDNKGIRLFQKRIKTRVFADSSEVVHDDDYYRCIRSHESSSDNEPGEGEEWQLFWIKLGGSETTTAWADGVEYASAGDFELEEDEEVILSARIRRRGTDGPAMDIIGYDKYSSISEKGLLGEPSSIYIEATGMYDRVARLWPIPKRTGADEYMLVYEVATKLVSPEEGADPSPLSDNWSLYLIFKLASILGPEYSHIAPQKLSYLNKRAEEYYREARKSNSRHQKPRRMNSCYGTRFGR